MKNRKTKGSNLPSININKQSLLLLNRLEGDEIKNILNAIQQYVYRGEEIDIDEELKDILESILDNIEHIGLKYINKANANRENGKKGGRPKKEQNKTINPQDSNNIPQEEDNTPESLKMAINEEFEEPQITEENNMGNYIGYIQNMASQVSGIQNTTEAQKSAYNVAFSQNDTNIPTEVKSVSNRPKITLNEIFEDAFLVDELKRWKNELMADNTQNFQMNAKVKVEQIANRYNYSSDEVWEELIGYIIDTDFENNVGDIPDWCWAEFKNCFLTTEEVSNGDYDKKLITVMKNKDEINRCYKILLNKYEGEKLATIKRFVNVAYKDMKFSYEN